ncbi:hypothetical protein KC363_g4340 [Hortaea werneckii]|nr:hypothetical protein KC363_g4340 [Hortaea werneckii]
MASARILHSRSLSCHPRCHTSFGTRQQRHVYSPTQLPRDVKQSVGSGKTTEFGKRLDFGANAALHIGHPKSRLLSVKTLPLVMRVFDHDLGAVFLGGIDLSYVPAVCQDPASCGRRADGQATFGGAASSEQRAAPAVCQDPTSCGRRADGRAVDGKAASSEQCVPSARTLPLVVGERTATHLSRCSLFRSVGYIRMLNANDTTASLSFPAIQTNDGSPS